jgi:hypothetical protein
VRTHGAVAGSGDQAIDAMSRALLTSLRPAVVTVRPPIGYMALKRGNALHALPRQANGLGAHGLEFDFDPALLPSVEGLIRFDC